MTTETNIEQQKSQVKITIQTGEPTSPENKKPHFFARSWWSGLGVIISALSLCVMLLIHHQTRQLTREIERQAEINRVRDRAERYFNNDNFSAALTEYKRLKELDSADFSGYYNFVRETKRRLHSIPLSSDNCRDARNFYLNHARELRDTVNTDLNLLFKERCKLFKEKCN